MRILYKLLIIFLLIIFIFSYSKIYAVFVVTYEGTDFNLPNFSQNYLNYCIVAIGDVTTNSFQFHILLSDNDFIITRDAYNYFNITTSGSHYTRGYTYKSNGFNSWTYNNGIEINYITTAWNDFKSRIVSCNQTLVYNGYTAYEPYIPEYYDNLPYFLNSDEDIALGEQDLIIMPGDFPNDKNINFVIQGKTETDDGQGGVIESWNNLFTPIVLNSSSQYYYGVDETGVGFYYKIPWSFITNYITISHQYDYILAYTINDTDIVDDLYVTYGGLTPEDAIKNSIANQTLYIQQQSLYIQETNQKIDELNSTINDDTITSSASDLPSINVNDPSETGIDNIFQSIYNAFCTGQAQDIVFPIPFTNKNITLSPYYVRDMLNNNGATWVYTLIQAFWGYFIGRFIVKDVSKKITKIKGGNIENIENENIKEEML